MSELKACQLCGHPENVDAVSVNAVPMAPTPEASRLREEGDELRTVLEAWQRVFGSTQLTHAKDAYDAALKRAEAAESALAKAREERDQYAEEARMMSDRVNRLVHLGKENEEMRQVLAFVRQTVHQAHHEGSIEACEKNTCDAATRALLAKREAPATKKKCRPCGATGFVQDTEGPRTCPTCGGSGNEAPA